MKASCPYCVCGCLSSAARCRSDQGSAANVRFRSCADFSSRGQFLLDHIDKVVFSNERIELHGSVPVRVSANEAAPDKADAGKIEFCIEDRITQSRIGLPPGERGWQKLPSNALGSFECFPAGIRALLDVASDPMSAMRRTPRQFCASNTKRSTACSNDSRGRAATPPYTSSRRGCFQGTAHTHSFAPLTTQRQNKSKYDAFGKMSQCMSQSRSPRRPAFASMRRAAACSACRSSTMSTLRGYH